VEPASALIGERNGRLIIKNTLDEPPFSWLLIFFRAHLGELAHARGPIAFDGHLKLLRSDQGHAHHRRGIEPARVLAINRRIAAGHSSPAHSLD
jgi:hypothetical protein